MLNLAVSKAATELWRSGHGTWVWRDPVANQCASEECCWSRGSVAANVDCIKINNRQLLNGSVPWLSLGHGFANLDARSWCSGWAQIVQRICFERDESMLDVWWTECQWNRLIVEYFVFSVSFIPPLPFTYSFILRRCCIIFSTDSVIKPHVTRVLYGSQVQYDLRLRVVTINFEKPWFVAMDSLYHQGLRVSYREFLKLIPETLLTGFGVTLSHISVVQTGE
jgi:hypothetical protein